jgi:hypothetical protein
MEFAQEQGLLEKSLVLDELFAPETLESFVI